MKSRMTYGVKLLLLAVLGFNACNGIVVSSVHDIADVEIFIKKYPHAVVIFDIDDTLINSRFLSNKSHTIEPVEAGTATVFNNAQQHSDLTMILTKRPSSPTVMTETFHQLNAIGIHPETKQHSLYPLHYSVIDGHVCSHNVCCTDDTDKGIFLTKVFDSWHQHPSMVIAVDDRFGNVKALDKALTKLGVHNIVIHYVHRANDLDYIAAHRK